MCADRVVDVLGQEAPPPRRVADYYGIVTSWLNSAGTFWIFCLMFLICADIASRYLFNSPIRGVAEIVAMSIVGVVFIQLANTLHVGRMTRAEMVIDWLSRDRPYAAAAYHLVFNLVGAAVFALIAYGTWPKFLQAWIDNDYFGVEGDFTAPIWPIKLIIVVGSVATGVEFLFLALREARALATGDTGHINPKVAERKGWPAIIGLVGFILLAVLVGQAELSNVRIGALTIVAMLILIYSGMQIGVALIIVSFVGIWMLKDNIGLGVRTLELAASGTISNFLFGVVPLFVLMGLLVSISGIGKETFEVAKWALARIRGGLGVATVAANAIFAAITGVSIASAAVFTKVAVPPMVSHGYTPKFAVGVVAGSSVLGMLIPPSLLLIIYGVLAEVSVGTLFIAAVIPGIVLATAFCVAIVLLARYWPDYVGRPSEAGEDDEPETLGSAVRKVLPIVVLVLLVLGGIYGGVFSPTEAGAAGAFGALVIALLRRRLNWSKLWTVLVETGHVSVSILFLIIAASIYSRMLTLSGIPMGISEFIGGAGLGFYGFVAIYVVIIILMGMILDSTSIMLIILPLALPIMAGMDGNLIWFGIVTVIAVEIGLLTPPLGLTVYVVKATLNDDSVSLNDIFAGAFPFVVIMLLVTVLIILVPQLSLLLV